MSWVARRAEQALRTMRFISHGRFLGHVYDEALKRALENAGHASDEIDGLVKLAREAGRTFGYFGEAGGLSPEVPNRMPLPR